MGAVLLKNELDRTVYTAVLVLYRQKVRNVRTGLDPINLMIPTGIKGKLEREKKTFSPSSLLKSM